MDGDVPTTRIKPNANKTINISSPFCSSSSRIHSPNGLRSRLTKQNEKKTFLSLWMHLKEGNGGVWFKRRLARSAAASMMDAHGCCCTCLMNPQATRHSLRPINLIYSVTLKPLDNHYDDHTLSGHLGPNQCPLSSLVSFILNFVWRRSVIGFEFS
jgi:hypothetical protein